MGPSLSPLDAETPSDRVFLLKKLLKSPPKKQPTMPHCCEANNIKHSNNQYVQGTKRFSRPLMMAILLMKF